MPPDIPPLFNDGIKTALNIPGFSPRDKDDTDTVYCCFRDTKDKWVWYIMEAEKQPNGDYFFYGLIDGSTAEMGYFLLSNFYTANGDADDVIRDLNFKPTTLGEVIRRVKRRR